MLHVAAHCRRTIVTAALGLLLAPAGCSRVPAPVEEGNPPVDVAFQLTTRLDASGQWPGWRGGLKAGVSNDAGAPISWSTDRGVRWKTSVPGRGNSSPVVWDEAVLITTAVETQQGAQLKLLCYDRGDGGLRWQADLGVTQSETRDNNGYASATVATDGDAIFSYSGGLGLFCHGLDGQQRWNVTTDQVEHIWGSASSPVLHGNLVIQLCEGRSGSFLAAYDKRSGQQVWRQARDSRGCWSTPVLLEARRGETSRTELIVNGTVADSPRGGVVIAYDPATG
ncbi:MAG: PQQ-binding-like beta-propeller repeat protein, partial [Planctomycetes bacterium]|nr:PQQ-binding-like beta-propeller repeat protein [Planctomycetota bacterium]